MMATERENHDGDKEFTTPPKLTSLPLPKQQKESPVSITPPLQTVASVPFLWEETPGNPRTTTTPSPQNSLKPKAARCLDLPPRLANEGKITATPSPTNVLEGPYSGGKSISHTLSFSFGKASFRVPDGGMLLKKQIGKEPWNFSSWRWESSFKKNTDDIEGIYDFSPSPLHGDEVTKKNKSKKRRSSLFGSSKSHLLASFYQSVKHVVQWRRKETNSRKTNT